MIFRGWLDLGPQGGTRHFSAVVFGQVIAPFKPARVFVGRQTLFDVCLELLGKVVASYLLRPGFDFIWLSSNRRSGWRDPQPAFGNDEDIDGAFLGQLICLIDSGTFSVADNLASCLNDNHPNITFVGVATGAGTGAPRTFTLPRTGTTVRFCTLRVYSLDGSLIEGRGVRPDVPLLRTRADVLAGRDTVLAAAIEVLGQ